MQILTKIAKQMKPEKVQRNEVEVTNVERLVHSALAERKDRHEEVDHL